MRMVLPLLLSAMIAGCDWRSSQQEQIYQEYAKRLANVLEVDTLESPADEIIVLPDKRELKLAIPRLSIGLLDSYELRKCGLFQLLAEKNSSLGKVQDPFRDMSYQLNVTQTMHACLQPGDAVATLNVVNSIADNEHEQWAMPETLQAELNHLFTIKQQHLPLHFHNLLTTSTALRNQLSSSQWVSQDDFALAPNITLAFEQLTDLYLSIEQLNTHQVSWALLEHQESLEKSELLGSLYFSLNRATQWLKQTTSLLKTHDSKIVCAQGRDKTRFKIINNVFQQFYISGVQQYSSQLDSLYVSLSPYLGIIEASYQTAGFRYDISQTHLSFRQANLEHVQYWQQLFERCGVTLSR